MEALSELFLRGRLLRQFAKAQVAQKSECEQPDP